MFYSKMFYKNVVVILAFVVLTGCSSNREAALEYAEFIKDKNTTLGQAIILHGRLLESFSVNGDIIDTDDFIAAEQILEDKLAQIGTVAEMTQLPLPSDNKAVKKAHAIFIKANAYLRDSVKTVTFSGYSSTHYLKAEQEWDEARDFYLKFSRTLSKLSGKELE